MTDDDDKPKKRTRDAVPTRAVTLLVPDAAPSNDEDDDDGPPPPPGRRDDEHVAPSARNAVTLFPNLGARGAIPDHLAVHRIDPPHGFVGRAPIDATEEHLADRFGGRSLRITVMTAEGKPVRNGIRTLTIERDPILPVDPLRGARAVQGVGETQHELERRLVAMTHETETRLAILKAEAEERERKAQREAEERERKAAREQQAHLDRVKLEHQQALERLRAESRAEAERSANTAREMVAIIQASATSQVTLLTESHKSNVEMMSRVFSAQQQAAANQRPADPMEAVKLGMQMAMQFGGLGGGKDDAEGALTKLVDVAREGFKAMQSGPRLPPPRNARALPAAAQRTASTGAGDATAPANSKQARVKTKLANILHGLEGQGYDVETVLDQLAAQLPGVEPAPAAAAEPAPAAPAPAAASSTPAAAPDDSPSLDDFTD